MKTKKTFPENACLNTTAFITLDMDIVIPCNYIEKLILYNNFKTNQLITHLLTLVPKLKLENEVKCLVALQYDQWCSQSSTIIWALGGRKPTTF